MSFRLYTSLKHKYINAVQFRLKKKMRNENVSERQRRAGQTGRPDPEARRSVLYPYNLALKHLMRPYHVPDCSNGSRMQMMRHWRISYGRSTVVDALHIALCPHSQPPALSFANPPTILPSHPSRSRTCICPSWVVTDSGDKFLLPSLWRGSKWCTSLTR